MIPNIGPRGQQHRFKLGLLFVFQIVNTRMAIFRKNGEIVYGPVPTNTVFKGFGGMCESHNNGDAVVRVGDYLKEGARSYSTRIGAFKLCH